MVRTQVQLTESQAALLRRASAERGVSLAALLTVPLYGGYYLTSLINKIAISVVAVLGLQLVMGLCGQISFGQVAFMAVGAYTSGILTLDLGWPFWIAMPAASSPSGMR